MASAAPPSLEEQRIALERDRLSLESRPARIWAPILVPAILGLAGTAVTGIITFGQAERTRVEQQGATDRADRAASEQNRVDNGRNVLSIYFEKIGDLRSKAAMTKAEQDSYISDLQLLEAVSGNPQIAELLHRRWTDLNRAPAGAVPNASPTAPVVNANASDLIQRPASGNYTPGQFVAFPQVPESRSEADAARLTDVLQSLGFDVQATQRIAPGRSPRLNQVRYYRADHAGLAAAIAAQMAKKLCADVRAVRIGGGRLPNGVMEFWLGPGDDAAFRSPCPGS